MDEVEIALNDAVNYIGYRLEKLPNHLFFEDRLGFRMLEAELDKMDVVTHIAPDSPAEMAKMSIRDKIVAVNGTPLLDSNFAEAFKTAIGNVYTIDIMRRGIPMRLVLTENADTYYPIYQIVKTEDATDIQKQNYKDWSGQEF